MIRGKENQRPLNLAAGYVRRSTDKQEQSIPDQKKAIENYATKHEFNLTKFYIDDAISGTSTIGRRAFQEMISDAQKPDKQFEKIIVYDIKRFGRVDNDEAGYYRYLLRSNGVEVIYVTENFKGDITDDLLRSVKQWMARQESKDLSKIVIRGLLSRVEGGWWMGGPSPYGYDLRYEDSEGKFLFTIRHISDGSKQLLDEKGNVTRTLARRESLNISNCDHSKLIFGDTERVKTVRQIFQMYAEQIKSYQSIADTLNQLGIPSPRASQLAKITRRKWYHPTIMAILTNPIYSGDMVWNRKNGGRFHRISQGKAVDRENIQKRYQPNEPRDWIVIRDNHPSLINRHLFEQARLKRITNSTSEDNGIRWTGQHSEFLLSSLSRCALCCNPYHGFTRVKREKRLNGTRIKNFYYNCSGHITRGPSVCQKNAIPKEMLESKIIETVINFYKPFLKNGGRQKLADAVKAQIIKEKEEIDLSHQKALTEIQRMSLSQDEIDIIVTEVMQFLDVMKFTLLKGPLKEKAIIIRRCIEQIWVNKPANLVKINLRYVPLANLRGRKEIVIKIIHNRKKHSAPRCA